MLFLLLLHSTMLPKESLVKIFTEINGIRKDIIKLLGSLDINFSTNK
jgi:hypothetical protein